MKGQDPQLEKAIEMVMKEIQEHPKKLPAVPRICRLTRRVQASSWNRARLLRTELTAC